MIWFFGEKTPSWITGIIKPWFYNGRSYVGRMIFAVVKQGSFIGIAYFINIKWFYNYKIAYFMVILVTGYWLYQ